MPWRHNDLTMSNCSSSTSRSNTPWSLVLRSQQATAAACRRSSLHALGYPAGYCWLDFRFRRRRRSVFSCLYVLLVLSRPRTAEHARADCSSAEKKNNTLQRGGVITRSIFFNWSSVSKKFVSTNSDLCSVPDMVWPLSCWIQYDSVATRSIFYKTMAGLLLVKILIYVISQIPPCCMQHHAMLDRVITASVLGNITIYSSFLPYISIKMWHSYLTSFLLEDRALRFNTSWLRMYWRHI